MSSYVVYDDFENQIAECADMGAVRRVLQEKKPDGFEVWKGTYDEDGFVPATRVMKADPMSDDPRVNEAMGVYAPVDTESLGEPWWKAP